MTLAKRKAGFLLASVTLLLLAQLLVPTASAHGGGTPQLVNETAGPYLVSVWTTPDPPRVGEYHLTIAVSEPGDERGAGEPVLGAHVEVRLEPQNLPAEPLVTTASNAKATNKIYYEADVALPAEGDWQTQIAVEGPAGNGSVAFPLEVQAAQQTNWTLIGGGGALLIALTVFLLTMRRSGE